VVLLRVYETELASRGTGAYKYDSTPFTPFCRKRNVAAGILVILAYPNLFYFSIIADAAVCGLKLDNASPLCHFTPEKRDLKVLLPERVRSPKNINRWIG
jgi:hypothetical protein